MGRFLNMNCFCVRAWILALMSLLGSLALEAHSAQAQVEPAMTVIVQGFVRDSRGRPLSGATVCLQIRDAALVTVHTDAAGAYRFSAVHRGDYTLRAEMGGYANATVGPFSLASDESRTIDITLQSGKESGPHDSSSELPEFFDEPHFTVAGVTDTTNLGGHGSDTIVRNREALAKATASLSMQPLGAVPLSSNAAKEKSLRAAVESQPASFDANYQLGKLLVDEGRAADALVFLERASQLKPNDYDSSYQLALARANTGDYERARADVQALLTTLNRSRQEKPESHHLLGEICEKLNNPLEALREYQRAAELNPTEPYFFDWGSELLLHHAAEPALEVFTKGNRMFPHSARMLEGLAASWYALGSYDHAVQRICEASDLSPTDENPYLFMGKMQALEAAPSEAIIERLERFVRLQPRNALANYYYAVSFWKQRKSPEDGKTVAEVKALLEKALQLDPTLGLAHLQLGVLYSERNEFSNAVAAYQRAIQAMPSLEEAHYRLAQAYRQTGETSKAQAELQLYEEISKEKAAEIERQRHEVQQFVYQLREPATSSKPN
jgi:tetratricopeptide (TPR) repeat protein